MSSARTHRSFDATPDQVWSVLQDWADVGAWFPGIASCEVTDMTRTLTLGNGAVILEEVALDPELRRLEYRVVGGDIAVEEHRATLDVLDVDGTTVVISAVRVLPDSRLKIFAGTLEPALDGLAALLAKRA